LHIEIRIKQYCNITFYFFTQDHSLPKICAMDLEETWQKQQKMLALGNDFSVSVAAASNILLNFE